MNKPIMLKGIPLNIAVLLALLLLLFISIIGFSGVKEGYMNLFIVYSCFVPIVLTAWKKDSIYKDAFFGLLGFGIVLAVSILFWNHMDSRDNYFSFENTLKLNVMGIVAGVSLLLGLLLRLGIKLVHKK